MKDVYRLSAIRRLIEPQWKLLGFFLPKNRFFVVAKDRFTVVDVGQRSVSANWLFVGFGGINSGL